MKLASLSLLALSMVACAPPGLHDLLNPNTHHDSYNFTENGCTTNEHDFEGNSDREVHDKMCWVLEDNAANNNCAESSRRALYYQKCDGTFMPY